MLLPGMEDFCFNDRRLIFSAINLPLRLCQRGRDENFLFLLIRVVLVDTHLYPAVQRCPDAKTDFDGKTCLMWCKHYNQFCGFCRYSFRQLF